MSKFKVGDILELVVPSGNYLVELILIDSRSNQPRPYLVKFLEEVEGYESLNFYSIHLHFVTDQDIGKFIGQHGRTTPVSWHYEEQLHFKESLSLKYLTSILQKEIQ